MAKLVSQVCKTFLASYDTFLQILPVLLCFYLKLACGCPDFVGLHYFGVLEDVVYSSLLSSYSIERGAFNC